MAEMILTSEGMKELEKKLETLRTVKRKEVSDRMKRALDHGDLSESAEYDEARNAYFQLEKDINEVSSIIAQAVVLNDDDVNEHTVEVGCVVEVLEVGNGDKTMRYRLVSSLESDPANGKISYQCPVGMALMQKGMGETVKVSTPGGMKKYKVISIGK